MAEIVSNTKSCLLWSQVTDFGLSVQKGGVGSENMLQATCGTPMYMGNSHTQKHTFSCSIYLWYDELQWCVCGGGWGINKLNEGLIKMSSKVEMT